MEFINLKKDTIEWEYVWEYVSKHPINEGLDDPKTALNQGEFWQYMGSYKNKDKIIHELRHRLHPKTNGQYKISLNGSEAFTDDQIETTTPIR